MATMLSMASVSTAADFYRPWVRTQDLTVMNVPVFEAGLGIETSGNVWYVDSGATGDITFYVRYMPLSNAAVMTAAP